MLKLKKEIVHPNLIIQQNFSAFQAEYLKVEKKKEDFVHQRVSEENNIQDFSFIFLGTYYGEKNVEKVDYLEHIFMAAESRIGYTSNRNQGFNPALNSTKATQFKTRDPTWQRDQRGSLLTEINNYFQDPQSHNQNVRQESLQRKRETVPSQAQWPAHGPRAWPDVDGAVGHQRTGQGGNNGFGANVFGTNGLGNNTISICGDVHGFCVGPPVTGLTGGNANT